MTDNANRAPLDAQLPGRVRLWFGMLGGAAAWTVHLIASSITAEWGGFAGLDQWKWLGVSSISWAVLGLSLVMGLTALAATLVAYRSWQKLGEGEEARLATSRFLAFAGLLLSGLFLLIIVAQTVPIFYYLREATR